MKRKDIVTALLRPELSGEAADPTLPKPARVAAGSIRAMGLELERLTEEASQAEALRQQLANTSAVVELHPDDLEPSFVADRLAPTGDPQYRQLVDSIRKDGQTIPILVRPNPASVGRYQIAYGHRRWHAAKELSIKVRAIVQTLSDTELVIAQGKENAERRNLSFIERALFAANLDDKGFDRTTINSALAVHSAETTRLLGVAASIPADIIAAIGPAPKAGRTRWMELANHLAAQETLQMAEQAVQQPLFKRLGSDARFEALITSLRAVASNARQSELIMNARGQPVVRVLRGTQGVRLLIDERWAMGFGAYLVRSLPELIRRFDESDEVTARSD
jgi:ParB family chromosome partitioning protein